MSGYIKHYKRARSSQLNIYVKEEEVRKNTISKSHQLKRKVFIRKIEDIRLLTPYEDYGIPVIPNFPLIDAVIGPKLFLQMTVSYSHEGAVSKLPDILTEPSIAQFSQDIR